MSRRPFLGTLAAAFALSLSSSWAPSMQLTQSAESHGRRWPGNPGAARRRRKLKGWQKNKC